MAKRYQSGNQSHRSKKDRKHNGQKKKDKEKFEDTKGVIRVRKSKNIKYNSQKNQRTNNELQNTTQKNKD
jgi:3-deoxy-D-manno-octulosonic-acid transferase